MRPRALSSTHQVLAVLASCIGLSSIPSVASATSFELGVSGSIQRGSCNVQFGNGGTFDYGTIPLFDTGTSTTLAKEASTLDITCDVSTTVAFQVFDNRLGTAAPSIGGFGLDVDSAGNPIGGYALRFDANAKVNGLTGWMNYSDNNGVSWTRFPGTANSFSPNSTRLFGFKPHYDPKTEPPQPYTTMSVAISTQPTIAPLDTLDSTNPIDLNGSATFQIIYL